MSNETGVMSLSSYELSSTTIQGLEKRGLGSLEELNGEIYTKERCYRVQAKTKKGGRRAQEGFKSQGQMKLEMSQGFLQKFSAII
jgi:hypothetical protein